MPTMPSHWSCRLNKIFFVTLYLFQQSCFRPKTFNLHPNKMIHWPIKLAKEAQLPISVLSGILYRRFCGQLFVPFFTKMFLPPFEIDYGGVLRDSLGARKRGKRLLSYVVAQRLLQQRRQGEGRTHTIQSSHFSRVSQCRQVRRSFRNTRGHQQHHERNQSVYLLSPYLVFGGGALP